jgi:hypothetical protein
MKERCKHLKFLVQRPPDKYGQTIAIVECDLAARAIRGEIQASTDVLNALITAMTDWVDRTEEGRLFWEQITDRDANIGDLLSCFDGGLPEPVAERFKQWGVHNFKVEGLGDLEVAPEWAYDTLLVDPEELDERQGEG